MAARQKKANDMVKWVNELLQYSTEEAPQTLDELKTGVAMLQIVHSIAPASFDLARVDFWASTPYHYEKNWKLLQEVMGKLDMQRDFIIERLSQGEKQRDLYMFVAYMQHHYHTLKEQKKPTKAEIQAASPENRGQLEAALMDYDPVAERNRALERRRLRTRPSASTGRFSLGDTQSVSETSKSSRISAFSSYSTRGMMKKVRFKTAVAAWVSDIQTPGSARRSSTPCSEAGGSTSSAVGGSSPTHPSSGRGTSPDVTAAAPSPSQQPPNNGSLSSGPTSTTTNNSGLVRNNSIGTPATAWGTTPMGSFGTFTSSMHMQSSDMLTGQTTSSSVAGHNTGLSDHYFIRDTILMDSVECLVGANFWDFKTWPNCANIPPIVDIGGDRVHHTFTYEDVRKSSKNRTAVVRPSRLTAAVNPNAGSPINEVPPELEADLLSSPSNDGAVAKVTKSIAAGLPQEPEENFWEDFDQLMETGDEFTAVSSSTTQEQGQLTPLTEPTAFR